MKRFSFPVRDEQFNASSYSDPGGIIKTCVEVAITSAGVAVRDSKDPEKSTQFYTNAEWAAFVQGVKAGEFG